MNKIIFTTVLALLAVYTTGCSLPPAYNTETPTNNTDNQNSVDDVTTDASITIAPDRSDTATSTTSKEVVFNITGKNFAFSKPELVVNKGDKVKIVLTSESGTHDWVIDEFNAKTAQIQDGETTETTFVADKAGTFEYYCSVGQHKEMGMVGNLIVRERTAG